MRPTLLAIAGALCCGAMTASLAAQQPAPIGHSDSVLTLSDPTLLIEDLAWDARTTTWYLSSVHQRRILAIGRDGAIRDFVPAAGSGMWSPFAVALDTTRNLLWVATAATPEGLGTPKEDLGRTAVLAFELGGGRLAARHELPRLSTAQALADLALLDDGTVIVSDSRGGGLYALRPGQERLDVVVPPGTFRSPQGPAGIPGTHEVIVADYSRGLARVDRRTGAVTWFAPPGDFVLKGIDGIRLRGHTLIVVQNGVRPNRVARLELDKRYDRIISAEILEAGTPGLSEPTHGTWVGDDFVFIANSGWAAMGADGNFTAGATLELPMLRRLRVPR
ncbi:MAG: hypothetical protein ABI742_09150 [Gemmatimonadota bacterium]